MTRSKSRQSKLVVWLKALLIYSKADNAGLWAIQNTSAHWGSDHRLQTFHESNAAACSATTWFLMGSATACTKIRAGKRPTAVVTGKKSKIQSERQILLTFLGRSTWETLPHQADLRFDHGGRQSGQMNKQILCWKAALSRHLSSPNSFHVSVIVADGTQLWCCWQPNYQVVRIIRR